MKRLPAVTPPAAKLSLETFSIRRSVRHQTKLLAVVDSSLSLAWVPLISHGREREPERVFLFTGHLFPNRLAVMRSTIGSASAAPSAWQFSAGPASGSESTSQHGSSAIRGGTDRPGPGPASLRLRICGAQLWGEVVAGDTHRLEGIFPIHSGIRASKQYGV